MDNEFYDKDLELDEDGLAEWSASEFCVAKLETVVFNYKACAWALQIPRRLGGGATGPELSADKKFMRRVMHLNQQLFEKWNVLLPQPMEVDWSAVSQEEKSDGARLDHEEFMRSNLYVAARQRASVATIGIQMGLEDWAKKAVRILSYEITNLERISRK